jgi:tetratricopeptide (TPR) repeat protein
MRYDQHGNPMSGDADAIALYDQAGDALLRYSPVVIDATTKLVEAHADVPMGHALMAYLYLTSTDRPDVDIAKEAWSAMGALRVNEREEAHLEAIGEWIAGDWVGASKTLDALLQRWPTDLLALQVGHQLDFFVGDAANLRDRPGRTLPEIDPAHPHAAFVRGMQAFGLEESGHYGAAETAGLTALEVNPDDVWAIHAVVHVMEMQGRVADGIRFLTSRRDDWGSGNLFTVHNWWHLALFMLETGDIDEALAIYDGEVHHDESAGVPLELLDASALLWRLYLDGHDTGARFDAIADVWATRRSASSWYVFNDLHLVMALLGAGRVAEAEQHISDLAGYVHRNGGGTNLYMTEEIGVPASRGMVRFAQGRYDEAVAELFPIRRTLSRFGGSHAQRDVLQRTLLEAAIRAGQSDVARALVAERLSVREASVYGWSQRARSETARGRPVAAQAAAETADAHRTRLARHGFSYAGT